MYLHTHCCFYLHSTARLHYGNSLQKLWVPLVLVHGLTQTHINQLKYSNNRITAIRITKKNNAD